MMTSSSELFEPPIREVIVFQPETFPLHRWDNSSPPAPPRRKVKKGTSTDGMPKLPFRRDSHHNKDLQESFTTVDTTNNSEDPILPRNSTNSTECSSRPRFLACHAVGPCRRPPSRSKGYKEDCKPVKDLHEIPLKPVTFHGKNQNKVQQGISQVLQEVVFDPSAAAVGCSNNSNNSVSVLFAIRRPGCGQCREHGMQLAQIVEDKPHVTLRGVLKETAGLHSSIRDFYANYFPFPLYLDEGWDLYHTIGNKKLSVFNLCARGPALEVRYARKRIRNIPLGGDVFTQGGVLIFDKEGKLRFVYYESYGKPLDMEAIHWAIDQANEPLEKN